jgi:glutaminyl-peptide cyclotransferase
MTRAPQLRLFGSVAWLWLAVIGGCQDTPDETVLPVEVTPAPEEQPRGGNPIEQLAVRVVAKHPHDRDAFTQGLLWHDGALYESTGRYGRSQLRKARLEDGETLVVRDLDPNLFGEGLARVGDELVQLTWRSGVAVVSDLQTLDERKVLRYRGEGWGLCYDGSALWMSDGSSMLDVRDPRSLALVRELTVWRGSEIVRRLNELECVGGDIYANVWQTDEILRIDSTTGRVTAVIDASGLLTRAEAARADVLNGIAYRPETDTFLLTGKLWPYVFEVEWVPR